MRLASRSTAAVSRAIHFLRVSPASTGSVAAVAVRSVETFTGSPDARRVSTRRSMSCSSAESFPLRFELLFEVRGKSWFVSGHDFSRAEKASKSSWALAPEVRSWGDFPRPSGESPSKLLASTSRPKSVMR